jgi:hypothetical protein
MQTVFEHYWYDRVWNLKSTTRKSLTFLSLQVTEKTEKKIAWKS